MKRILAVSLLAACGCEGKLPPPRDTGAKDATRAFFEGLAAGDSRRAYDALAPESRRRVSPDRFSALAQVYGRGLGFPAERVHVRSCEEHGDAATAHVVLMGQGAGHTRRFEDGATLRCADGRWGVVLPLNFGSAKPR